MIAAYIPNFTSSELFPVAWENPEKKTTTRKCKETPRKAKIVEKRTH